MIVSYTKLKGVSLVNNWEVQWYDLNTSYKSSSHKTKMTLLAALAYPLHWGCSTGYVLYVESSIEFWLALYKMMSLVGDDSMRHSISTYYVLSNEALD